MKKSLDHRIDRDHVYVVIDSSQPKEPPEGTNTQRSDMSSEARILLLVAIFEQLLCLQS